MKCPKCNHELSEGAIFCGNCGQRIESQATQTESVVVQQSTVIPTQTPVQGSEKKATVSFVLGMLGLIGWVIPLVGITIGILALIFGASSLNSNKKSYATTGVILGFIVILLSLFAWGWNIYEAIEKGDFTAAYIGVIANSELIKSLFRFVF